MQCVAQRFAQSIHSKRVLRSNLLACFRVDCACFPIVLGCFSFLPQSIVMQTKRCECEMKWLQYVSICIALSQTYYYNWLMQYNKWNIFCLNLLRNTAFCFWVQDDYVSWGIATVGTLTPSMCCRQEAANISCQTAKISWHSPARCSRISAQSLIDQACKSGLMILKMIIGRAGYLASVHIKGFI